jgi:hypothetical protein
MQADQAAFREHVNLVRGVDAHDPIPENNLINFIWNRVLTAPQEQSRRAILAYIVFTCNDHPDYINEFSQQQDNNTIINGILAKFERNLTDNVRQMWQEAAPLTKLYYIEFVRFYIAAQQAIANLASQQR